MQASGGSNSTADGVRVEGVDGVVEEVLVVACGEAAAGEVGSKTAGAACAGDEGSLVEVAVVVLSMVSRIVPDPLYSPIRLTRLFALTNHGPNSRAEGSCGVGFRRR